MKKVLNLLLLGTHHVTLQENCWSKARLRRVEQNKNILLLLGTTLVCKAIKAKTHPLALLIACQATHPYAYCFARKAFTGSPIASALFYCFATFALTQDSTTYHVLVFTFLLLALACGTYCFAACVLCVASCSASQLHPLLLLRITCWLAYKKQLL